MTPLNIKTKERKITLKKFVFSPNWSFFDILLWGTFVYKQDLFSDFWAFNVGYIIIVYYIFFGQTVREWGIK